MTTKKSPKKISVPDSVAPLNVSYVTQHNIYSLYKKNNALFQHSTYTFTFKNELYSFILRIYTVNIDGKSNLVTAYPSFG